MSSRSTVRERKLANRWLKLLTSITTMLNYCITIFLYSQSIYKAKNHFTSFHLEHTYTKKSWHRLQSDKYRQGEIRSGPIQSRGEKELGNMSSVVRHQRTSHHCWDFQGTIRKNTNSKKIWHVRRKTRLFGQECEWSFHKMSPDHGQLILEVIERNTLFVGQMAWLNLRSIILQSEWNGCQVQVR